MNAGRALDWAINFRHVTGEFDADNTDVVHDLQAGAAPRTTLGLVTEALAGGGHVGLPPSP
jgi:mannitol 2-dehydrogenase